MDRPAPVDHGHQRASPALYRLLVDSVADYAIFMIGPTGHVMTWNRGAARLKGYSADEIIGQHFSKFYTPEEVAAGKPERILAKAAREGRAEDESWRVRKDGSRFWANVVITALRDPSGTLVGFAKVTRDLTERKRAEQHARELAASQAARAEAERRNRELTDLTQQLQEQSTQLEEQATELEQQTSEAQALAEELEESNSALQSALAETEEARDDAQRAQHFSEAILHSISDPFVVQDADWRFQYVNHAAEEVFRTFGLGGGDALRGRVLWDVYPQLEGTGFAREMRRAMADRVPVSFEEYSPRTGEWSEVHCYPMPTGGLATQWKLVTDRKQAEEAAHYLARASEVLGASLDYETTLNELARLVVPELADWCTVDVLEDGAPRQLAVAHVDPEKVRWAREIAKQYPPDQNAPTGVPNVLRTGKPELVADITDEMIVAGAVDDEHLRMLRELGLRSAILVPLVARGRTLGALTVIAAESGRRYNQRDLALLVELGRRAGIAVDNARLFAESREAREQADAARNDAEIANRAKSEFLAHMSHELRTPLNAISGYAQLLAMGIHGPVTEEQRAAIARITVAQQRLLGLVNDVLNFARLEAGRVDYDVRPVRVRDVIDAVVPMVEPQLAAKGIALDVSIPSGPSGHGDADRELAACADPDKLEQVMLNLLSNAVKFTGQGGRIAITVTPADGEPKRVRIEVRDTGVGISPEKLSTIFQPFVQIGRTLSSGSEGSGLGLSISRDLARGMGGDITVESEPGHGSTFTVVLRRAESGDA